MGENGFHSRGPAQVEVRPAEPGDFEQLLSLFEAVAAERRWIGTEPGFDKAKYRAAWQDIVDGKGGAHFVAAAGNTVVGAISLYPTSAGDHDLGILVSREQRGRGIGEMLLQAAFDWAQGHGVPKLTLGVFPHNAAAIRLYEKTGFVAVGRLERKKVRQTGDVWDVIAMEKRMPRTQISESAEPVTLESYDERWPEIFTREAAALRHTLERFGLQGIEHVGSTAIPGMTAKPIVDIMAGFEDVNDLPGPNDSIWRDVQYEWGHGSDRPDEWLYFIKRDAAGNRVAHLHAVRFQGAFWNRLTAFRDALREDAELAKQYQALKERLADDYRDDRLRYRDEKSAFVSAVVDQRLRPRSR